MQVLWIGCWESEEEFERKADKGYNLAAAQVSQTGLINGIEQVSGLSMDSINGSVLPPYPVYKDRIVEEVVWSHREDAYDISVGYKNDKYINRVNCKNAMLSAAAKWIKTRYQGGELQVLVYSMRSAPMATACYIKRKIPNAKIHLIITDLPQFMDLGQSKLKAALKKIDWLSIQRMQKKFDSFILFAEKMADYLKIPKDKWMLMEGSYDKGNSEAADQSDKKKAIMYSGRLDVEYGIPMLLEAFTQIEDPEAQLWLTGGGNAVDQIKDAAEKDPRIKFYGFLPKREDVIVLQRQASLLINMRLPMEEASNYCFPSKLFEYMASGVPVLTFLLGGIPQEYRDYLYMLDECDVKSLSGGIQKILSIPEEDLIQKGKKAKEFILSEKTSAKQSARIVEFICK